MQLIPGKWRLEHLNRRSTYPASLFLKCMAILILSVLLDIRICAFADTIVDAHITSDTTWTEADSPYLVTSDVWVKGNKTTIVTLTIEPGVVIKFSPGTKLKIGHYHSSSAYYLGALSAIGTAGDPIVFTSSETNPQPGDWQGVEFTSKTDDASSILDHCVIEYGGDVLGAGISMTNASPTIQNSTITNIGGHGILLKYASSPIIGGAERGNQIRNNGGDGIHAESDDAFPIIEHNTISQNSGSAMLIPTRTNSVHSNNGSGNGDDRIVFRLAHIQYDTTWRLNGFPYLVTGIVKVSDKNRGVEIATLEIEPGVIVNFQPDAGLQIGVYNNSSYRWLGSLIARGTEEAPVIFSSANSAPQPGDWRNIYFDPATDDATAILDHCIVEYGGSVTGAGVSIQNASPKITNSIIRNNSGHGILLQSKSNPTLGGLEKGNRIVNNDGYGVYVDSNDAFPVIEYNTISNNAGIAMLVPPYINSIHSNTGSGNGSDKIALRETSIRYDTEWKLNDLPYLVTNTITVAHENRRSDTATLKIAAGNIIQFGPAGGLKIGVYNTKIYSWVGALEVRGTEDMPVLFTSASLNPQPGDWKGIHFDPRTNDAASILENCIVEYGGSENSANIFIDAASPTIIKSVIRNSSAHGIRLSRGSDPIIGGEGNGNTISGNAECGIFCEAFYSSLNGPEPTITENVLSNNGTYPMRIRPQKTIAINNTGSGNGTDAIALIEEDVLFDSVWDRNEFPYLVNHVLRIRRDKNNPATSAALTIKPGVIVKFAPESQLMVGINRTSYRGALNIRGTKTAPVQLTSSKPTPSPGDWMGVYFSAVSDVDRSAMRYCNIEYGGFNGSANLHFNKRAISIENCTIRKSAEAGIRYFSIIDEAVNITLCTIEENGLGVESDSNYPPSLVYNLIRNNQGAGVINRKQHDEMVDGHYIIVHAPYNWWGAASGPTPQGTGDSVSGRVAFAPHSVDPEDLDNDNVWDPFEFDFYASLGIINSPPDDDSDEMPDDWEYRYGLDLALNDAYLDLDGDGYFNIIEYRYDIDPSSFADAPDIGVHYEYDALGRITRIYRFR